MTSIPFFQVDAFVTAPLTGNPAAIMPLEKWLDDALMQAIAAENNLSETAFTVPGASEDADFDLRADALATSQTRAANLGAVNAVLAGQYRDGTATLRTARVDLGEGSIDATGTVGETLALAPSKEYALALWRSSPPHWDLLMLDGLSAAGVGRVGDRWVMSPGACPAAAAERCELGASGEPATPPPAEASTTIARRHFTIERSDLPPRRTIRCSSWPSAAFRRRTRTRSAIPR